MKKTTFILLLFATVILSGFTVGPVNYEQIAFEFFFSNVFNEEFKDVKTVEFDGVTKEKFKSFNKDAICFAGLQKLYPEMNSMFNSPEIEPVKIESQGIRDVQFDAVNKSSKNPKLFVSHKITMINNIYLMMTLDKPGTAVTTFLFEMQRDGKVSSVCKTERPL